MYPVVKASWKEFTYEKLSGKPSLRYHPNLDVNRRKIGRIHVSVSHDGEYVYSSVLIEGNVSHLVRNSWSMRFIRTCTMPMSIDTRSDKFHPHQIHC